MRILVIEDETKVGQISFPGKATVGKCGSSLVAAGGISLEGDWKARYESAESEFAEFPQYMRVSGEKIVNHQSTRSDSLRLTLLVTNEPYDKAKTGYYVSQDYYGPMNANSYYNDIQIDLPILNRPPMNASYYLTFLLYEKQDGEWVQVGYFNSGTKVSFP